jgi:hypothetical protein
MAVAIGLATFLLVYAVKDHSFIADEGLGVRDRTYLTRADTRASETVPAKLLEVGLKHSDTSVLEKYLWLHKKMCSSREKNW